MIIERDLKQKIERKAGEISRQKKELEESLRYAGSIQSALLPDTDLFSSTFSEGFVLFRPRDIVSGDFYYLFRKDPFVVVVAADCTGHGVPGAFMSILGISFLNEIMGTGIFRAGVILNKLREKVMKAMHQTGEHSRHKDGMDISLCVINLEGMRLCFSGANNPLYLIRNGKLKEFKGDRMPIGIDAIEERPFCNHEFDIYPGDSIYLFSDGFPDQFGGPFGKKIKYKPFKKLLVDTHRFSMRDQRERIEDCLVKWMGNVDQVDDILVIGIRI